MINEHAIKFSSRRRALRELQKGYNKVLEQDGKYSLKFCPHSSEKAKKTRTRKVIFGIILPTWFPNKILRTLRISPLNVLCRHLKGRVEYLNLGCY